MGMKRVTQEQIIGILRLSENIAELLISAVI
jgi:hypothetical protein